jgi:ABC-type transporter Mla subunit MlaD
MRSHQGRLEEIEERAHEEASEDRLRELKHAEEARLKARQELARARQVQEAEKAAAERRKPAIAGEDQLKAVQEATEQLVRSIADQIESLKEAAAAAPADKRDVEHEIQRLQAALDALESGGAPKARSSKTPRPQP